MSLTAHPHPPTLGDDELATMRTCLVDSIETNLRLQDDVAPGAAADAHRAARESLERALLRLDAGTYGACTSCGDGIPIERLEFVPDAELCMTCTQRPRTLYG